MNLKNLNNHDLDARVKFLWKRERAILHELLLTLKEVESRCSYLESGYSSLFDYLVREVGCDGGTAQRRIDAVRLMMDVPEVVEKIQSGELSLNKISMIQQACREVKKIRNIKVDANAKLELVHAIIDKDPKMAQKEIAHYLDMPVVQATVQKVQADESVRVELTIQKELYEKIQEAQALLSHALGTNDLVSYLGYVTERVIKQKTSVRPSSSGVDIQSGESNLKESSRQSIRQSADPLKDRHGSISSALVSPDTSARKSDYSFSARTKKKILKEEKCCQYRDPETLRLCGSKWFLQVDHLYPKWAGGAGEIENGQVLCAAHNQMKYRQEVGIAITS